MTAQVLIWIVIGLGLIGVIFRPFGLPEAIWPAAASLALVGGGLLPWRAACAGIAQGGDVYLFLAGMMLLAELARQEGLFDWLAAHAAARARGSPSRLFTLIYLVGIVVTVFLSNDATAVVLTPAVAAAARSFGATDSLPFLFSCAFIANAASFVLPISNPANLVVYGSHMPTLLQWLPRFALPSLLSITTTFLVLRLTQASALARPVAAAAIELHVLSAGGRITACGIAAMALALAAASAFGLRLGAPIFLAGCATLLTVWAPRRRLPVPVLREISWNALLLVAGLFVLVQALAAAGGLAALAGLLQGAAAHRQAAIWGSGLALGLAGNLMNNLPAGLIAGKIALGPHLPPALPAAMLLGVDIGPNLSVTGSLATILWLAALRREGITITAWQFLKLGVLVMPPALLLALATT